MKSGRDETARGSIPGSSPRPDREHRKPQPTTCYTVVCVKTAVEISEESRFFSAKKNPTPITLRCCRGLPIAPSPAPEHKKPPTLDRWISAMHYKTIVLELFQDLNPALHEQPRKDACMRKFLGPPIRLQYHDWIEQ